MVWFSVRKFVLCVVLTALLFAALGFGGGFALGKYRYPHTAAWDEAIEDLRIVNRSLEVEADALRDQSEAEYYRGMFDVWAWVGRTTGQPVYPMAFVEKAHQSGWYGQASTGWRWPLSE